MPVSSALRIDAEPADVATVTATDLAVTTTAAVRFKARGANEGSAVGSMQRSPTRRWL